ncbi:thioredoxin reductase [Ardenticatena maritima]|uniref:Thioredoxin reductase n=1 Tax=Ardenticatena maritima TaxID=872965 RepID=A0A0M8K968_9CHLR|nr:FAD-dependent oxidoreductase [Ardenticatena maritima]GAP62856.1 thioredoxin reductase [Ardenticatena maritima]
MSSIRVYGALWCPDCRRSKAFLNEHQIAYEWIDIEEDADARRYVETLNDGKRIIPTIVFPDGSYLVEPSNAELAQKLGLKTQASRQFYDLIVIGGGPAGLTAALYTAREGIRTLVIEKGSLGGQAATTQEIENMPGFPDGISGQAFAERLARQVDRFGVEVLRAQEVRTILQESERHRSVKTSDGSLYGAHLILIATGARYRRLDVPGERDFIGAGIHFCATCDGPFYRGKPVVVVGGGNSAAEESVFLTQFASEVTLLVRGEALTASKVAADKVLGHPKIRTYFHHEVRAFHGKSGKLEAVDVEDTQTGERKTLTPAAVFVFIGQQPNSEFVRETLVLDARGFILTGHDLEHAVAHLPHRPEPLETSMPGVFAAGDVRAGSIKQIAAAVGEGAAAALFVRNALKTM